EGPKPTFGRDFFKPPNNPPHLASQYAGATYRQASFAFFLMQREDDGIAFDEDFAGSVLRKQFVDRIVEVEAEVGGRVQTRVHQRARQTRRIPDVGLDNHVAQGSFFRRLLLGGEKEFVERAVNGGEFAQLGVADEIDAVEGRVQGLQTAHVAVIAQEVAQKTPGNLGSIGTPATGHAADGSVEIVGGKSAPFLNQALDAVTFGPIDQRILQLLRID